MATVARSSSGRRTRPADTPSTHRVYMKPPSIIEFLISLGGVRDDMGDLRAMDLHRVNKGVFGRLAHKKGMSLDRAREVCEEARYIRPDSTISDLLEAIRDQASGLSRLT